MAALRGFGGQIEIPRKVLIYNNALPVKNQMKNVFRENQSFTKFYLGMPTAHQGKVKSNEMKTPKKPVFFRFAFANYL